MDENRNICHALFEEYALLKQKVEAIELSPSLTLADLKDLGITESDLERIRELEKELDTKCQDQFPKYERIDLGPGLDNGFFSNLDQ